MAVAVLTYHHTPVGDAASHWDVPLPMFRTQVELLIDAGTSFIPFVQAFDWDKIRRGMHIALTFDDGHRSNIGAFEYLAKKGIRPTAFIVRDWSQIKPGFMRPAVLSELRTLTDFGGHGATHTGLSTLSAHALHDELISSKAFLEDILQQPVTTMALPGGLTSSQVLRAARAVGYDLIGDSIQLANFRPAQSVHRLVVTAGHGGGYPLQIAQTKRIQWIAKNTRHRVAETFQTAIGARNYGRIANALKSALQR